jgi:DNA polymerase-3 subunit epsilon/ATP-dependent DNA helicase DinG
MSQSPTLVAIDLETTGLDPQQDAILEIGAVKFKGDRIEDEFQTLINPGRAIPRAITALTGITDAMVLRSPRIADVLPELETFCGEDPIVGHNVRFDLGFLRARKLLRYNEAIDTFPIAAAMLPTAPRYSLGALAKTLGVLLPSAHRALDDTRATAGVYQALYKRALQLPLDTLAEIVNLQQDIDWGANLFFEEALRARSREMGIGRRGRAAFSGEDAPPRRGLPPADEVTPLDARQLAKLLEPQGPFDQHFQGYEYRPEQVKMLTAVARAFSEGKHLMVEAGTGTGKSFAYLIPAAQWAIQNGKRLVISTNTINLQEQLLTKDIPDLAAALKLPLEAALLKGRSNYVCPRRLDNARRHRPRQADEMRVLAKILVWLTLPEAERPAPTLGVGDRGPWLRLSAEDENCTTDTCLTRMKGVCPFFRARRAAEHAHLVVVNHALLLADIATENRVLPAYEYLVLDEAHHLEAATTEGLSFTASARELERTLRDLGGLNSGALGDVLGTLQRTVTPDRYIVLEAEATRIAERAVLAGEHGRNLFEAVSAFLETRRDGRAVSEYGQNERITPQVRGALGWGAVTAAWEQTQPSFDALAKALTRLRTILISLSEDPQLDVDELEEMASRLNLLARFFTDWVENLHGLVQQPDANRIYWAAAEGREGRVSLNAAPLHVGSLVEKHLWSAKESVVMASATMTTAGDFSYIRGRLNAGEAQTLAVGSPFDYQQSTLLYLATDIPEPFQRADYQNALEQGLIDLCLATHGRTLALFTSFAQLKQTATAIRGPLTRAGLEVYDQSDGTSRSALLDNFKTSDGAVLLGTRSFWEGVDVPGDALSVLVIAKLPFDVPDDPIIAARAETFERPFEQFSVPEAVLKFRQGFGRLIRTKTDRGVVAVFDRRIVSKGYGRTFLDSLPRCTVKRGPLAGLAADAKAWLNR